MDKSTPQNIPDVLPLLSDAAVRTADEINSGEKKRNFISKGEHLHKWSSYLAVDWIFNAAVGVTFAYWGKFTEAGRKIWSEPITRGFTKALTPFIKNVEQRQKSAGYGNIFMSIIAGGMFTIPPLMVLENNKIKKSIIKFWDRIIYGKDKVENDPKFQQAYDEIHEAPKKDFVTGVTSRFAALAPLLAIVLIPTTKKISNKIWFDHVEHASEAVATKVGFGAEKSFKNIPLPEAKSRWKFIHESVAMDFGLGVPYAVLHAFFYNMFASSKDKKKQEKQQAAEAQTNNIMAEAPPETKNFISKEDSLMPQASHAAREMNRRSDAEITPVLGG